MSLMEKLQATIKRLQQMGWSRDQNPETTSRTLRQQAREMDETIVSRYAGLNTSCDP